MAYWLSRAAEQDILALFVYGVEAFGEAQAEQYHDQIENSFQFLADNPYAARERTEIVPPVRMHPVGAHIAVYLVEPSGDILILRVRHRRESWDDQ
jgi:toxin ParE1/3/4